MKNKLKKQKRNKFIKPVIMPTAAILTHITVDGIPDNDMIKTTFIEKNSGCFTGEEKPISSIKNFLTDELTFHNIYENVHPKDVLGTTKNNFNASKKDENFEIEFLENDNITSSNSKTNNKNIGVDLKSIVNYQEKISFSENNYQNSYESTYSKKFNDVKNEFKINELRSLMSNINHELTNRINQKGKIIMSGHKFDENALYRQFETSYECGCHSCQRLNSFKKENSQHFKNIYGNVELKEQVEVNHNFLPSGNQLNSVLSLNSFAPGYHSEFKKNYEKFEKEYSNETIYSQTALNKILNNKICKSIDEFLTISNSLEKKKSFLNDLKNGKFGLNELNKVEIGKMIERLLISERAFLNNNMNYLSANQEYGK